MRKTPTKYTADFKLHAVQLALQPGVTQTRVAEDLGIPNQILGRWIKKHKEAQEQGRPVKTGRPCSSPDRSRKAHQGAGEGGGNPAYRKGNFKAGGEILRGRNGVKYRFMEDNRKDFALKHMARMLGVEVAAYLAWKRRPEASRKTVDQQLKEKIKKIHRAAKTRMGHPELNES